VTFIFRVEGLTYQRGSHSAGAPQVLCKAPYKARDHTDDCGAVVAMAQHAEAMVVHGGSM